VSPRDEGHQSFKISPDRNLVFVSRHDIVAVRANSLIAMQAALEMGMMLQGIEAKYLPEKARCTPFGGRCVSSWASRFQTCRFLTRMTGRDSGRKPERRKCAWPRRYDDGWDWDCLSHGRLGHVELGIRVGKSELYKFWPIILQQPSHNAPVGPLGLWYLCCGRSGVCPIAGSLRMRTRASVKERWVPQLSSDNHTTPILPIYAFADVLCTTHPRVQT
jgi:hypothetical protein